MCQDVAVSYPPTTLALPVVCRGSTEQENRGLEKIIKQFALLLAFSDSSWLHLVCISET